MTVHPAVQAAADEHRHAYLERKMTPPDPDELVLIVRALALVDPEQVWSADAGTTIADAFAEAGAESIGTCVLCGARALRERRQVEPRDLFWNGSHLPQCPYGQARRWAHGNPPPPPAALALHLSGTLEAES